MCATPEHPTRTDPGELRATRCTSMRAVRSVERGWSHSSAELPLQIGRIDASASWRAVRVAEANDGHQWALLLFGRDDKLPICRPPVAWDHFDACSASVMGPPVRQ